MSMSKSSSSAPKVSSWSELTVSQLKSQLRELNLPVSGVKSELVQRLVEHQASSSAAAPPENSLEDLQVQPNNPTRKRSTAFPPPKDDTEIQVAEKEVQETVRLLDGLKLGGGSGSINVVPTSFSSLPSSSSSSSSSVKSREKQLIESLKKTLKQSQQGTTPMRKNSQQTSSNFGPDPPKESARAEKLQHYMERLRLQPANNLKAELLSLRLSSKGRKPDLVRRLAEHYVARDDTGEDDDDDDISDFDLPAFASSTPTSTSDEAVSFAGIPRLSSAAANALHRAFCETSTLEPTPIQSAAISKLYHPPNPSALLHAPTGSGKSIAFLLPITETLWREVENDDAGVRDMENGMALVLLPTRELAAQMAGVATVLAPPGMVRLVPRPMDLTKCWKDEVDRGEELEYLESRRGDADDAEENANDVTGRRYLPRILVGSAKSIAASLFGDKKMPGTPTPKPQGKKLLGFTRWLVLDEVDRLLNVKKSRTDKRSRHERPAAMLAAAVSRLTLGRVQVVAASATVGRPLRRELARVLGLHGSECPRTLRGEDDAKRLERTIEGGEKHLGRAVKIPNTVRNYVLPVDGSTSGTLLTSAAFASKAILRRDGLCEGGTDGADEGGAGVKVLLVLTRHCGIQVHNAMGALRHFGIRPEPRSLLDELEADGADRLVEAHRRVSGVEGAGGARRRRVGRKAVATDDTGKGGYLLVTHEDNVRGLHLDGLDVVVVVGRPGSPDEYTHIAGRTGRAGRGGSVLNVVGFEQAAGLASWTRMLGVDFLPVDEGEIGSIVNGLKIRQVPDACTDSS